MSDTKKTGDSTEKEIVKQETESSNEKVSAQQNIVQNEPVNHLTEIKIPVKTAMEAHHPHHVTHKKKWPEYLLEFFMLFLAVFLGFVAENIREDLSEHRKAKAFAASLKSDLETDTAELTVYNTYYKNAANNIDTFMQLMTSQDLQIIPSGKLYWYGLWGGSRSNFIPNDATFQQMKSAGAIELFKSQTANDIEKYDRLCRLLQSYEDMNKTVYAEVRKARALIFDFKYNEAANRVVQRNKFSFNQASIDSFIATNPALLTHDKVLFNQYIELVRSRFIRNYNVAYSDSLMKQANIVLADLNNDFR